VKLSKTQLETYDRDGYLVMPGLFSAEEVGAMKVELRRIQDIDTDHLVRERSGGIAKTIYRVHEVNGPTASPVFHAASRCPRMLEPAQGVLGDESLYVYHTKCNLKTAIDGSVWQWHQDYGTWRKDGVPEPALTTALVMLDKPTEFNGCLYFIPGSHKVGSLEPRFDEATAYKFWVVAKEDLLDIMARSPEPVPITGEPGTVVFFHPNILHASGHNLSQHDRWAIYVVYNQVANRPLDVPNPRPDYVRSTNFAPLKLGSDTILAVGRVAA
jgi:ectoine hydroxylase